MRPAVTFPLLAAPSGEKAPENRICGGWGVFSVAGLHGHIQPTPGLESAARHHPLRFPPGREEGCQARLDGASVLEILGAMGHRPAFFCRRIALISLLEEGGGSGGRPPAPELKLPKLGEKNLAAASSPALPSPFSKRPILAWGGVLRGKQPLAGRPAARSP